MKFTKVLILSMAAALLSPIPANSGQPEDSLKAIVNMEASRQFCGFQTPPNVLVDMIKNVHPYINMTDQQFVARVRVTANELGSSHVKKGTIHMFCSDIADVYARIGAMK